MSTPQDTATGTVHTLEYFKEVQLVFKSCVEFVVGHTDPSFNFATFVQTIKTEHPSFSSDQYVSLIQYIGMFLS